jgi:hypothetical protein
MYDARSIQKNVRFSPAGSRQTTEHISVYIRCSFVLLHGLELYLLSVYSIILPKQTQYINSQRMWKSVWGPWCGARLTHRIINNGNVGAKSMDYTQKTWRFELNTALTVKIIVFWDVLPCSLADHCQRFGETCCLHLQHRRCFYLFAVYCLLDLLFGSEDEPVYSF